MRRSRKPEAAGRSSVGSNPTRAAIRNRGRVGRQPAATRSPPRGGAQVRSLPVPPIGSRGVVEAWQAFTLSAAGSIPPGNTSRPSRISVVRRALNPEDGVRLLGRLPSPRRRQREEAAAGRGAVRGDLALEGEPAAVRQAEGSRSGRGVLPSVLGNGESSSGESEGGSAVSGRRYGRWAGNPAGVPEDTTRCVEAVWGKGAFARDSQCRRKRGKGRGGLYCGQHARRYPEQRT